MVKAIFKAARAILDDKFPNRIANNNGSQIDKARDDTDIDNITIPDLINSNSSLSLMKLASIWL